MRVIVSADALGYSPAVNAAIGAAVAEGLVTSVSVLATGPGLDEALAWLRSGPPVSVGVHLDLTEGRPLTAMPGFPLSPDGHLSPRSLEVGGAHQDAVVAEWCAQVARVLAAGVAVDHLDTHQHVHYQPALFRAFKAVQRRTGIHRARTRSNLRDDPTRPFASLYRWRRLAQARWFDHRLRTTPPATVTTDVFASVDDFRRFGRWSAGTVELMCHPGNPAHARYTEELAWLREGGLRRPGVTLIRWTDL